MTENFQLGSDRPKQSLPVCFLSVFWCPSRIQTRLLGLGLQHQISPSLPRLSFAPPRVCCSLSYLQLPIAAGWQGDHWALFSQMCSWVKGLWLCCFSGSVQIFPSVALGFPAVGEDHWSSCTLAVSQLWEVPPVVPLLFIASILKPYVFASWLLLILALWVNFWSPLNLLCLLISCCWALTCNPCIWTRCGKEEGRKGTFTSMGASSWLCSASNSCG